VFDATEFEAEKKVVIEELKTGLDSPWGILMQELDAAAYKLHPYRNPVVGWLADVELATTSEQQAYYRKYYQPNNAIIALAGDFDADEALEATARRFGSIPSGLEPVSRILSEPQQRGEKRVAVRWRSKVPRLAMAYHAPAIADSDSYALQTLAVILAEGKASRLYQRMVERERSVTFVTADYGESKDPTLFHIRAEARGEHTREEIEAAIYNELEKVAGGGVDEREVSRAKRQIEAHYILSRERTLDQAMLLGQMETLSGLDYIDTYLDRISRLTASDIARVAAQYLQQDNRTVAYLVSDGSENGDGAMDENVETEDVE
jgi:zinc protease